MDSKQHPIVNVIHTTVIQKIAAQLSRRKRIFLRLWFGQFISAIGSRLTGFALGIWVYQQTGSMTQFALIYLCSYCPEILISPFAGVFVDRWGRRSTLILGDSGAGVLTLAIALLITTNYLNSWLLYPILLLRSSFMVVQATAFSTTVVLLAPERYWGKVSGLLQLAQAGAQILAPFLASVLLITVQIQGVLWLDFISFLISFFILLTIKFSEYQPVIRSSTQDVAVLSHLRVSWRYLSHCPLLLKLLGLSTVLYFTLGALEVLFSPLILSFASTPQLGIVLSICGCGWLTGSIIMSMWGGPERKIDGVTGAVTLQGLFLLLGGLKHSLVLGALGGFGYLFTYPIAVSCMQTIWQSEVSSELQGRIFGMKRMIEHLPLVIAYLSMGTIAENIFEPMLSTNGILAGTIGSLIGTGRGRGIGLLFMLLGLLNVATAGLMLYGLQSEVQQKSLSEEIKNE